MGIQFVPTERNQFNADFETDFLVMNNTPENIGVVLQTSCYDCHINNTEYPLYNKIQPIALFLEDHIKE